MERPTPGLDMLVYSNLVSAERWTRGPPQRTVTLTIRFTIVLLTPTAVWATWGCVTCTTKASGQTSNTDFKYIFYPTTAEVSYFASDAITS